MWGVCACVGAGEGGGGGGGGGGGRRFCLFSRPAQNTSLSLKYGMHARVYRSVCIYIPLLLLVSHVSQK